ncbi:hypothetical protein FB451DRAFT_1285674 [Mycena latifolia]|nr:hypothetical protein FB451DRAFT_1285674 [Mycena latifolia]
MKIERRSLDETVHVTDAKSSIPVVESAIPVHFALDGREIETRELEDTVDEAPLVVSAVTSFQSAPDGTGADTVSPEDVHVPKAQSDTLILESATPPHSGPDRTKIDIEAVDAAVHALEVRTDIFVTDPGHSAPDAPSGEPLHVPDIKTNIPVGALATPAHSIRDGTSMDARQLPVIMRPGSMLSHLPNLKLGYSPPIQRRLFIPQLVPISVSTLGRLTKQYKRLEPSPTWSIRRRLFLLHQTVPGPTPQDTVHYSLKLNAYCLVGLPMILLV